MRHLRSTRLIKLLFLILLATTAAAPAQGSKPDPNRLPARGVTFFYLDGVAQDFPWVLAHQHEPAVRARIDAMLAEYRRAGVNWIRLLVSDNFFVASRVEPVPSAELIKQVNDFLVITHSGANAGKFHVELVLTPHQDAQNYFTDTPPYRRDKRWLEAWITHLDFTDIGIVMLGGDLSPCVLSGCYGDAAGVHARPVNHGRWITSIWAWKENRFPRLNASYEVIGVQVQSHNDPVLIKKLATWAKAYTPSIPVMAASLYVSLDNTSTASDYAKATQAVMDAYASISTKPLWIDEYGTPAGGSWSLNNQRNGFRGILKASLCHHQHPIAVFAWVAGRDYPYRSGTRFGLVESFKGNTPQMAPAWIELVQAYAGDYCAV